MKRKRYDEEAKKVYVPYRKNSVKKPEGGDFFFFLIPLFFREEIP